MVSNESSSRQYAKLLRNYGIAVSRAILLIVNNFGKSLLEVSPWYLMKEVGHHLNPNNQEIRN